MTDSVLGSKAPFQESAPEDARRVANEELTAYERWELPLVGDGMSDGVGGPLTAAQIEEIQQQAFEEAFARGRAEGLSQGLAAGREAAREEMRPVLAALGEGLDCLARPLAELDDEIESSLVTLATTIACQLLHDSLEVHPERMLAVVHAGLQALPTAERAVQIELHPEDACIVREALASAPDRAWGIRENAELTRGGCHIESDASRIDATVEARIESVIAHVLAGSRDLDATDVGDEPSTEGAQ